MPEHIKDQLKRAVQNLLSRPPSRRGPWFISDEQLQKFLDEN